LLEGRLSPSVISKRLSFDGKDKPWMQILCDQLRDPWEEENRGVRMELSVASF